MSCKECGLPTETFEIGLFREACMCEEDKDERYRLQRRCQVCGGPLEKECTEGKCEYKILF